MSDAKPFRINNVVGDHVCGYSLLTLSHADRLRFRRTWRNVPRRNRDTREVMYEFAVAVNADHDYYVGCAARHRR